MESKPDSQEKLKPMKANVELARSQYSTVHVDKMMIAIDHVFGTASITLLQMHMIPLPRPSAEWGVEGVVWDIVGELKVPLGVLNNLLFYYAMDISNGLDIGPLLQKHLEDHPNTKKGMGMTYGPITHIDLRTDESASSESAKES